MWLGWYHVRIMKWSNEIKDTTIVLVVVIDWINNWLKTKCDGAVLIFKLKVFNYILGVLSGTGLFVFYSDDLTLANMMSQWDLTVCFRGKIDLMQDGQHAFLISHNRHPSQLVLWRNYYVERFASWHTEWCGNGIKIPGIKLNCSFLRIYHSVGTTMLYMYSVYQMFVENNLICSTDRQTKRIHNCMDRELW